MKKIVILLCFLWMGFIFYMSSNNGAISHEQSNTVVKIIEKTESKLKTNGESKAAISKEPKANNNDGKANVKQVKLDSLDHIIRKNAHGFMYMVLALLVSSALFTFNKKGKDAIVYILFICLFYAVTDEFHQAFVPGRTSLISDVLVDFCGALIGLTVFYLFYYKLRRRNS